MAASLDKTVAKLAEIKAEIVELEDMRKLIEAEIIDRLEQNEADKIETNFEGSSYTATIVRSSSLKFDEQGLAGAMSPSMWTQISRRVLDSKLLEDKVARGSIDVDTVAKYSEEVERKPYLKLTKKGK